MRNILAAIVIAVSSPALAQSGNAINLFGSVSAIEAGSISVKDDKGGAVETFIIAPKLLVLQNRRVTLADIKANDFVASAAAIKDDGKLHSTEVRIFPDALRGVGEGQRPMNDAAGQTMTNATVTGQGVVNGSNHLKVIFAGGESELIVDPGVPVTRIEEVGRELVKAGAKVRIQGVREAGGALVNRITILE